MKTQRGGERGAREKNWLPRGARMIVSGEAKRIAQREIKYVFIARTTREGGGVQSRRITRSDYEG